MARAIHKQTLRYLESVHTPDLDLEEWVLEPDMSFVVGIPSKYWKLVGNKVMEMTPEEKALIEEDMTDNPVLEGYNEEAISLYAPQYKVVEGVELLLNPGTYKLDASLSYQLTRNNCDAAFALFADDVILDNSERKVSSGGSQNTRSVLPLSTFGRLQATKVLKVTLRAKATPGGLKIQGLHLLATQPV